VSSGEQERSVSAPGDFYVQDVCCTSCGVPQAEAPDLVGWANEDHTLCYWKKQPETPEELDRAIRVLNAQELMCHRYAGKDPYVLHRVDPHCCDYFHQVAKRGPQPKIPMASFQLTLRESGLGHLRRLWNRLLNQFIRKGP
jgi:hypothetical protein